MTTHTKMTDEEAIARFESGETFTVVRDATLNHALAAAAQTRDQAQNAVDLLVVAARSAHLTWVEIAIALGVSSQAARQRYKHLVDS